MSKRAIILAGGKGTRLKPYTITLPKPLVPIGEKPILEIIINKLKKHGFNHITITVNHFADIIKAFFGDGSKWGLKIDYSLEDKPLGTMGPLTLIDDLPENFLIMNGDVLTDLNFDKFYNDHLLRKSNFTVAAHKRLDKVEYGVLHSNDNLVRDSSFKVLENLIESAMKLNVTDIVIPCVDQSSLKDKKMKLIEM